MKESEGLKAKGFLLLLLCFFLMCYALIYEPGNLIVTRNGFDILPDGARPLKIAFVSDIHIGLQREGWLDQVVDRICIEEPDIVLLGGDYIESNASELDLLSSLGRLRAKEGAYAVLGNHDYGGWGTCNSTNATADAVESRLESLGITVLRNEHRMIGSGGDAFALIGLDDDWACYDDLDAASEGVPAGMPRVVLTHNLNAAPAGNAGGPAVVLAGHTHCGMVRLPYLTDTLLAPGFGGLMGGRGRISPDAEAYVTCGATGGGMRFLTSPEISIITIE